MKELVLQQYPLVFQATRPVQNYLKMPYDEIREQQQTARHLPLPLYVLYMQASAYQQACGKDIITFIYDLICVCTVFLCAF